jgi:hypothetical protein
MVSVVPETDAETLALQVAYSEAAGKTIAKRMQSRRKARIGEMRIRSPRMNMTEMTLELRFDDMKAPHDDAELLSGRLYHLNQLDPWTSELRNSKHFKLRSGKTIVVRAAVIPSDLVGPVDS